MGMMKIVAVDFHSIGILPSSNDLVNICKFGKHDWNTASFNTQGFKLSGPADLHGFNDTNLLYVSSGLSIISERLCVKLWSGNCPWSIDTT